MDISGVAADIHIRTDANNLVTTASTTHLPEQKETIHMINQLRTEACSGAIDDLAHVVSADCLSDCLTKASARPDALIKTVNTGVLPNCDRNPPFRKMMENKHKAYGVTDWLIAWLAQNLPYAETFTTFLGFPIAARMAYYLTTGQPAAQYS